ncbi:MAG: hypothetical protein V7L23_12560 [Nostoc sp.]
MTVKELIEQLQALPQDAQVSVENQDGYELYIIGIEFTGKFVIVKIEGE